MQHVVDVESTLTSLIQDYEVSGSALITKMQEIHKLEHEKQRSKLDAAKQEQNKELRDIMAAIGEDTIEVKRHAVGVVTLKKRWIAPAERTLKDLDAMMKLYC